MATQKTELSQEEFYAQLRDFPEPSKAPEGKPSEAPAEAVKTPEVKTEVPPVEKKEPAFNPEALSDAELEALLQKRGKKVVSATEVQLTEEEKRHQREAAKLRYALDQNLFTKQTYDQYQQARAKGARAIVFDQFVKDQATSGKSVEQLDMEFSQLYHEHADAEHAYLTERRRSDMEREAARLLKQTFPEIHSLDRKFDQWESDQQTSARQAQEQNQQESAYQGYVTDVFSSIQKQSLAIQEDKDHVEQIEFDYPPELLTQVKAEFESPKVVAQLRGASKEQVQQAIEAALLKLSVNNMVSHSAKLYHSRKMSAIQIGRKNMNPDQTPPGSNVPVRDEAAYEMVKDFLPAAQKEVEAP